MAFKISDITTYYLFPRHFGFEFQRFNLLLCEERQYVLWNFTHVS